MFITYYMLKKITYHMLKKNQATKLKYKPESVDKTA